MYGAYAPTEAQAIDYCLGTSQLFILSTKGDMYEFSVTGTWGFLPPYSYAFSTMYSYGEISPFGTPPLGIGTMMFYGSGSVEGIVAIAGNNLYQYQSGKNWRNMGTMMWLKYME